MNTQSCRKGKESKLLELVELQRHKTQKKKGRRQLEDLEIKSIRNIQEDHKSFEVEFNSFVHQEGDVMLPAKKNALIHKSQVVDKINKNSTVIQIDCYSLDNEDESVMGFDKIGQRKDKSLDLVIRAAY